MNAHLNASSTSNTTNASTSSIANHEVSYAEVAATPKPQIDGLALRSPRPVNGDDRNGKVQFVLTDLHPHIPDWTEASKRSENLNFISESVDAANAPRDLLKNINGEANGVHGETKVFRLYNLAFHHFGDELGGDILKNTVETADGFGYVSPPFLQSSFFPICLAKIANTWVQYIRAPRAHHFLPNNHVRHGHNDSRNYSLLLLAFSRPSIFHIYHTHHSLCVGI